MTLGRLWAFLAVGLPVLAAFIGNLSSVDLAYHLRAGGIVLDTGRIPTADTFTFTAPGAPWLNQQWGAQTLFAAIFRVAGWTGLAVFRAILVGLLFGFLFEACRRRGADLRRAAWLTLAAFIVSAVALALRPQLVGMVLMALTLLLIANRRDHPRVVWAVPFVVLAWANIHGSFFLGPVVLGLAWLEDVHDRVPNRHRLLAIAVVSAAAAIVNPFTVGVWSYALGLSTNAFVTSRITEWQPTTLRTVPGILFFGSLALVTVLLARRGRAVTWPTWLSVGLFAAIGAYAIRGVAWWPLGAAVVVAGALRTAPSVPEGGSSGTVRPPGGDDTAVRVRRERSSAANLVVVAMVVLACALLFPGWRGVDSRVDAPGGLVGDAPPGITAALRDLAEPGDRVLNPQPWGSWFELAVPEALMAIDSRIEVFPADVWATYDVIRSGGPGWEDTLASWDPTIVVTTARETELVTRLEGIGWRISYTDAEGAILVPGAP